MVDVRDIPVITGGDQAGTLFMTLTMLRRLDDELEGVVHDKGNMRAAEG